MGCAGSPTPIPRPEGVSAPLLSRAPPLQGPRRLLVGSSDDRDGVYDLVTRSSQRLSKKGSLCFV
ncbi:hypothetical protein BC940DRAFT_300659 [Gongronella butleri]|nr:hypothetical protein BC940DRAFT_300659 [Gongronella butleri]